MNHKSETVLPKVGYLYHYPRWDHPTDHFRLDIHIFTNPTEQHFDIERTHFFVKSDVNGIERLTVSHPWSFEKTAQVCAGLVEMRDRKGKQEEAFTFGGALRIDSQESLTICTLVSSAPILEISGASSMHRLFIEEVEILLAERQAGFAVFRDFEKRLIAADPQQLYFACLEALIHKFESFPNKDVEYMRFLEYLHKQQHRLHAAGLPKGPTQALDDIL
jgi:hypothetical protein